MDPPRQLPRAESDGSAEDGDNPSQEVALLHGGVQRRCLGVDRAGLVVTLVSGIGLLTDLFDFSVINIAKLLLADIYGDMSAVEEGALTAAALFGAVVGQLVFGVLADKLGRRYTFLASAFLTMLGSLGSALAYPIAGAGPASIYTVLALWRFVMGVGIGGEYPLSAANTAEGVVARASGQSLAAVYSMMGLGTAAAPLLFVVLLGAGASYEATWRLGFAAGAVLSLAGLALRSRELRETDSFLEEQQRQRGAEALASLADSAEPAAAISASAGKERGLWVVPLVGTAASWFLYDIVHYGLGLYSGEILGHNNDPLESSAAVLGVNALALPFFFLGIYLVRDDVLGRRNSQLAGFAGMTVAFLVIVASKGAVWDEASDNLDELHWPHGYSYWLFLALYTLQLMFDVAGPGMSTYVIPGEIYPTRMRATCHGISAAAGKLGAVVGSFGFPAMREATGLLSVMLLCGVVTAVSVVLTAAFTPGYTSDDMVLLKHVAQEGGDEAAVVLLYRGETIRREIRQHGRNAPPAAKRMALSDLATCLFAFLSPLRASHAETQHFVEAAIAEELRMSG